MEGRGGGGGESHFLALVPIFGCSKALRFKRLLRRLEIELHTLHLTFTSPTEQNGFGRRKLKGFSVRVFQGA